MFFMQHGPRKVETARIAALGSAVDFRAAGVGQVEHFGHLVEGLAGSIIAGTPQQFILPAAPHMHQQRVSPGDDQAQVRHQTTGVLNEGGKQVPLHVVDGNVRFTRGGCQCLCRSIAHQERRYQPRAGRGGKYIHLLRCAPGFLQCLLQHTRQVGGVVTRGQLRDNAAV